MYVLCNSLLSLVPDFVIAPCEYSEPKSAIVDGLDCHVCHLDFFNGQRSPIQYNYKRYLYKLERSYYVPEPG